jgi:hypothetical protein
VAVYLRGQSGASSARKRQRVLLLALMVVEGEKTLGPRLPCKRSSQIFGLPRRVQHLLDLRRGTRRKGHGEVFGLWVVGERDKEWREY